MDHDESMTRLELIRLIGDVITEIDVLRADFRRESETRKDLDNIRNELDTTQRKLVRDVINDNTKQFKRVAASIKIANEELRETISDVDNVAKTLATLVKFVGFVQKVAELIPK